MAVIDMMGKSKEIQKWSFEGMNPNLISENLTFNSKFESGNLDMVIK